MLIGDVRCRTLCLAAATAAILVAGCRKDKTPTVTPKAASTVKTPVAIPAEVQPAVAAMLAKADVADGTIDKIVSKCAGCALRMDGSEQYEFAVSGYKMRFCSKDCKGRFEKDPAKAILAMDNPGD